MDFSSLKQKIEIINTELSLLIMLAKYCDQRHGTPSEREMLEILLKKYNDVLYFTENI